MSHFGPEAAAWRLKTPISYPDAPATPPAYAANPPASTASWPGIRLPTTPSAHPYFRGPPTSFHSSATQRFAGYPQRLPAMPGEDQRASIVSPTPRYPSLPSPGAAFQPPKLELEMLRQQPGFWSPQPRPPSAAFAAQPQRNSALGFHSPPASVGASLPPKFLAKQSPSVTPPAPAVHPKHQGSQLSACLSGNNGSAGLLSIQTSSPSSTTGSGLRTEEPSYQDISPSSTTPVVQDTATSSSDALPATAEKEATPDDADSTATSPGHVTTSRISPNTHPDNSSSSAATDTPTSLPDEERAEEKGLETVASQETAMDTSEAAEPAPLNGLGTNHSEPSCEVSERVDSALGENLVMDEASADQQPSSATPTSQESAQALLSLAQGIPQPSSDNVSAALRLEEKIAQEAFRRAAAGFMAHGPQASVTRPPGLGPAPPSSAPLPASFPTAFGHPGLPGSFAAAAAGGQSPYQCPICGFSSTSKFHFNSHMNTHTDHQCTMCDYTARTEGRLKRHMEGHSEEDRLRAGVNSIGERLPEAGGARSSDGRSQGTPDTPGGVGESSNQSLTEPSPLERLQMQLEDTAPTSITASIATTPEGAGTQRRSGGSSSKPKNYKCKQCEHVSRSKEESWRHARIHIKPDKLLTCPQCEFVTEYKHHLEYHLRNHFGSKPFQCQKCHYSCVNKSMLNSHMKSHSQFYQFRCSDCTYATKYCHSLKLHLRKYNHRPATVITPDGQHIDPTQNLDLYGTRARARNSARPNNRQSSSPAFASPGSDHPSPATSHMAGMGSPGGPPTMVTAFDALQFPPQMGLGGPSAMSSSIATLGARLPTIPTIASLQMQMKQALIQRQAQLHAQQPSLEAQTVKCHHCDFHTSSPGEMEKHVVVHMSAAGGGGMLSGEQLTQLYEVLQARAQATAVVKPEPAGLSSGPEASDGASTEHSPSGEARSPPEIGEGSAASSGSPISKASGDETASHASVHAGSSRRKGKARKLDSISRRLQECKSAEAPSTQDEPKNASAFMLPQRFTQSHSNESPHTSLRNGSEGSGMEWDGAFICRHCRMAFMHEVMYQIHMGFHGYDNPFRCNRCGHDSPDELALFMHIAQSKH